MKTLKFLALGMALATAAVTATGLSPAKTLSQPTAKFDCPSCDPVPTCSPDDPTCSIN